MLLVWLLIQTPPVQKFLVQQTAKKLSSQIGTEVKIKHVDFTLLNSMNLDGILIKDLQKDTLLYAGSLKIRITDWFIFKKNITLKYIGLEDAVLKMQRSDSTWNFDFIANAFANKDTVIKKERDSADIKLNLQKLDLKNVTFLKSDEWYGQKMNIKVGSLLLNADTIDIKNKNFIIESLEIDNPVISIFNYKGKVPVPYIPYDSGYYFNQAGIKINLGKLTLHEGFFSTSKEGAKIEKGKFEGKNIQVNKVDGSIENISFIKDTIRGKINLSGIERCGLELKKIDADFKLTPQVMEFSKLNLHTNKSILSNYYAMHFKDFNVDMANYVSNVIMEFRMKGTELNTDDIAFFAPNLKSWKREFKTEGKFYGKVSDFSIKDLSFDDLRGTKINGSLTIKGLPDPKKTTLDIVNANVITNSTDLAFVLPGIKEIKNPNIAALGNINFKGNFNGTLRSYKAKGNLTTSLGNLDTDLAITFPENDEPTYKGNISTQLFNLGEFINAKDIGNISFIGNVDGYSFKIDKIKANVNGILSNLAFKGYTYQNLNFNGEIYKQKVSGDFNADDPNFNFTSNLQIDLTDKNSPKFNILGDLSFAHLKELNLANDKVDLTGLFDLNFKGKNIDDFLGYAKILNASVLHNGHSIDFDSLSISAAIDTGTNKILSLNSNQFNAIVNGKYSILSLPNSFQSFLNHYYPSYIKPPKQTAPNQDFTVTLNTNLFEDYTHLIDTNLSGLNHISVIGHINTSTQKQFNLFANIPFAKYKQFTLEDATINGDGNNDTLALNGTIGRFYIGDSLFFPNTNLNIKSSDNHSIVKIATSTNNKLNDAQLNADLYMLDDGLKINFRPSSFVVNEKTWNLEEQGEIVILKNFASAKNMKFTQGIQEINIKTEQLTGSESNELIATLVDLNLGDFAPLFTKKPLLEGIANGEIKLRDFYNNFKIEANLNASQFRMDNDSIGLVFIKANYDKENGKVDFSIKSDNEKYVFAIDGIYNKSDSSGIPFKTKMELKNTNIALLNQFLSNVFSNISGFATGEISIEGNPKSPDLIGHVKLTNAGITVNYTKVHYTIDSAEFVLSKSGIDFGKFQIKDKYGNTGYVKGKLYEHWFNNMKYDFEMMSDKMLLIDTKKIDNASFYGNAIGKANMTLKGPQENMEVIITGESTDSSHIYIPTSNSRESVDADYIHFKQYGAEMTKSKSNSSSKINVKLNLTATTKTQIDVILDELTGDQISARGNGKIIIIVPSNGNMTMEGRYDIEGGEYDFNFQSITKKPFTLVPDANSYIKWTGDPYKADINLKAKYTAKNVSLSDLLANTNLNLGSSVQTARNDVYIVANLTGKLQQPDIKFNLEFPTGSGLQNDDTFTKFLAKLQSNDNEMLKQVTWLIVFGTFAPYQESFSTSGNVFANAGIGTISQFLSNGINRIASDILYKITGDKSWQFNFDSKIYSSSSLLSSGTASSSSGQTFDQTALTLKLSKSLLNGKIIITIGSDIGISLANSSAAQSALNKFYPDLTFQFILSKDRNLRAILFNRSSLDISTSGALGRRTRQGVSMSYTKDFDGKNRDTIKINN